MRKYWALLLPLCVVCAGSGPSARPEGTPPMAEGKGRIYFFRAGGLGGAALQPTVYLSGQEVGKSKPGTYFHTDREPGSYEVKCEVLTEHGCSFSLQAGKTVYVETTTRLGVFVGRVLPRVVSANAGTAGVGKCAYIGSSAPPSMAE